MNIGITGIGVYIPERMQQAEELVNLVSTADKKRSEVKMLKRMHHLHQTPIVDEDQPLEETIRLAVADLKQHVTLDQVDLILYSHALLTQVPYQHDLLYKVLQPFGLENIRRYGVAQLNCASPFASMQLIQDYMDQTEARQVLLLCGDQTNLYPKARYVMRSLLIGDAATAVLFSKSAETNRLLACSTHFDDRFSEGIYEDDQQVRFFNEQYQTNIFSGIQKTLAKANRKLDDVDYILPHNVNRTTWRTFCQQYDFPLERVVMDLIPQLGHTYTTDSQLVLHDCMEKQRLNKGDTYLMIAVGLGCFVGSALFEY
ncbi:ketoacyl-ACP synthase III family protein [Hazenella sp. IB182357]|uniref:Ketoacyl-ACP synthase III family protein n=1 Tax=Polycladospora coralii TaxID=2771432 RepID=A0A926N6X1_9BACL|nr:ketoacyl-ACP synthase III family protein [Polycladospora coralii]MBD1372851.1 ketoacyl-ACP synthase III family protein [Polycladospora coralii]MBS7529460.1 ketoacyl-ACP synthase III family protein [Polycladospora coralii]